MRNYLLPNSLATVPTEHNMKQLDRYKERVQKAREARVADLKVLAEQIQHINVSIEANANEEGHLYGSVGPAEISKALKGRNLSVEPDMVKVEGVFKECGLYEVQLNLGYDIETKVQIAVVRSGKEVKQILASGASHGPGFRAFDSEIRFWRAGPVMAPVLGRPSSGRNKNRGHDWPRWPILQRQGRPMAEPGADRVPPQESRDAERCVLGSMLRDNIVIPDIINIIRTENFYFDAHQKIFDAVTRIFDDGKPVDLVILANIYWASSNSRTSAVLLISPNSGMRLRPPRTPNTMPASSATRGSRVR